MGFGNEERAQVKVSLGGGARVVRDKIRVESSGTERPGKTRRGRQWAREQCGQTDESKDGRKKEPWGSNLLALAHARGLGRDLGEGVAGGAPLGPRALPVALQALAPIRPLHAPVAQGVFVALLGRERLTKKNAPPAAAPIR